MRGKEVVFHPSSVAINRPNHPSYRCQHFLPPGELEEQPQRTFNYLVSRRDTGLPAAPDNERVQTGGRGGPAFSIEPTQTTKTAYHQSRVPVQHYKGIPRDHLRFPRWSCPSCIRRISRLACSTSRGGRHGDGAWVKSFRAPRPDRDCQWFEKMKRSLLTH
jgi:hypothetical protein